MNGKTIGVGFVAALALVVGGLGFFRPLQLTVNPQVNVSPLGSASATHTEPEQFLNQVFISRRGGLGGLPGITTSTVGTPSARQICTNSVVDITLPNNNGVVVLPSSTAMFDSGTGCLTRPGDWREFFIMNASGAGNFSVITSDQSSTLRVLTVSTSSGQGTNGTSSLNFGDVAKVIAIRTASSTTGQISLRWVFMVFR